MERRKRPGKNDRGGGGGGGGEVVNGREKYVPVSPNDLELGEQKRKICSVFPNNHTGKEVGGLSIQSSATGSNSFG